MNKKRSEAERDSKATASDSLEGQIAALLPRYFRETHPEKPEREGRSVAVKSVRDMNASLQAK